MSRSEHTAIIYECISEDYVQKDTGLRMVVCESVSGRGSVSRSVVVVRK